MRVRQAAVLGAGVMGAQIAAHVANANKAAKNDPSEPAAGTKKHSDAGPAAG